MAQNNKIGSDGELCLECGAPLATDQRYCLNCGHRRSGPRLDFERFMGPQPALAGAAAGRSFLRSPAEWTPMMAIAAIGALAVMLVAGVLLGRSGTDAQQVIASGAATPAAASSEGGTQVSDFKSDWPEGKTGYTVQLVAYDNASTTPEQVATAKSDAETKGASDVGALDSDQFGSLAAGSFIIYSGVFDSDKDAKAALAKLTPDFPDATVIKVSTQGASGDGAAAGTEAVSGDEAAAVTAQLQANDNATGSEAAKQSAKLPDNVPIPGKLPPKDNKKPGGGSKPICIGC